MSIQVSPDVETRIRAQVSSGQFQTENDVLREAMDSLEKRQAARRKVNQLESRECYLAECAKLDPEEEQGMAEEWSDGERELWNAS